MPLVEYKGQRVVTFAMVDQAHQRPNGTASAAFRRNRERFTKGKHYFDLNADEIRNELKTTSDVRRRQMEGAKTTGGIKRRQLIDELFPKHTKSGIVITEMGYLLLVKPFTDELSWQIQEQLVEAYFRTNPHFSDIRPVLIPSLEELEAMPLSEAQNLLAAAEHKSKWRHGKHGSAEMTQRKRELKVIRPAIERITALVQLTIPELGAFK
ncbi:ORF6N domain-containing protein [Rosenbergiella nectarea subsp. apis]|nr:ORF6N domain-containing protein [Rosenbergiella nectarea subsp. apis]